MPDKATLLLIDNAIRTTQYLYEVYKTDELREYLRYLKTLFHTEYSKTLKESESPQDDGMLKIII